MASSNPTPETITTLMKSNLLSVFNERDPAARLSAIKENYTTDVVFHEPGSTSRGHDAIDKISGELLGKSPDWVFKPEGPVFISQNVGMLRWTFGPRGGEVLVKGCDIAEIEGGLIKVLHVMIEGPSSIEIV
jgi:hypothetical protein